MPCFTTPKQLCNTCLMHHKIVTSRRGTLSSCLDKKTYEAKSLQLMLTACCLAHIVLNVWSYLRLPDDCYPVADLPYRDGILTRWKYRPCSAAHPFFSSVLRPLLRCKRSTQPLPSCKPILASFFRSTPLSPAIDHS